MEMPAKGFHIDKKRLIDIASVTMLVHALCGLLRYLTNITVVLALDYTSTLLLLFATVVHCIQFRPKAPSLKRICLEHKLLIFVFLWCIVSTVANFIIQGKEGVSFAPNALHDVILTVFVYFPFGIYIARNDMPSLARKLLKGFVAGWSLFMVFVLVNVFMGRAIELPGKIMIGGTWYNSTFCLNNNPNHTSCIESVFLTLCLFLALRSKQTGERILFCTFSIVHFTGMVLSNSRTYLASILFFLTLLSFFAAFRRLENQKTPIRIVISALIALAVCGALCLLKHAVSAVYEVCPHYINEARLLDETQPSSPYFSTVSFRIGMWKACVKALFTDPLLFLFGNGPANSKALMLRLIEREYYTHNQFIEIAACAGVPCLLAFAALVVLILKDAWQVGRRNMLDAVKLFFILYLLSLLLANTMEALLMFYRRPGSYVFYISCGWICEQARLMRTEIDTGMNAA